MLIYFLSKSEKRWSISNSCLCVARDIAQKWRADGYTVHGELGDRVSHPLIRRPGVKTPASPSLQVSMGKILNNCSSRLCCLCVWTTDWFLSDEQLAPCIVACAIMCKGSVKPFEWLEDLTSTVHLTSVHINYTTIWQIQNIPLQQASFTNHLQ